MKKQNLELLEQVRDQFEEWRATKKAAEQIPDSLWCLARNLIGNYKITEICNALRISHRQLKNKVLSDLNQYASQTKKVQNQSTLKIKAKGASFVDIPAASDIISNLHPAPAPALIIERSDGVKLTLQGATMPQYLSLLQSFCQVNKENV